MRLLQAGPLGLICAGKLFWSNGAPGSCSRDFGLPCNYESWLIMDKYYVVSKQRPCHAPFPFLAAVHGLMMMLTHTK